jgi:hypothetical protein
MLRLSGEENPTVCMSSLAVSLEKNSITFGVSGMAVLVKLSFSGIESNSTAGTFPSQVFHKS